MPTKLLIALYLCFSFAATAAADDSATAAAVSTPTVVISTIPTASSAVSTMTLATPYVSTMTVVPPLVSTSSPSHVVVSSVTEPVDHVENVLLRRFLGTIRSIDPAAYKIALEGPDGKISEFILTNRTRATTDDGHRIHVSALKPGDRVIIRYVEKYNYVRKIDILPTNPQ